MPKFFVLIAIFILLPCQSFAEVAIKDAVAQKGHFSYFSEENDIKECVKESLEDKDFEDDYCGCKADIHYPIFSGLKTAAANKQVNYFFLDSVAEYKCNGHKSTQLKQVKNHTPTLRELHFTKKFRDGHFLSIVQRFVGQTVGAAHYGTKTWGRIIDTDNGNILNIKDIFGNDKNLYVELNKYIISSLLKYPMTTKDFINKDTYVSAEDCDGCSFYVDEKGRLTIAFNPYVVAPFDEGEAVELAIPKRFVINKELADVLRE